MNVTEGSGQKVAVPRHDDVVEGVLCTAELDRIRPLLGRTSCEVRPDSRHQDRTRPRSWFLSRSLRL